MIIHTVQVSESQPITKTYAEYYEPVTNQNDNLCYFANGVNYKYKYSYNYNSYYYTYYYNNCQVDRNKVYYIDELGKYQPIGSEDPTNRTLYYKFGVELWQGNYYIGNNGYKLNKSSVYYLVYNYEFNGNIYYYNWSSRKFDVDPKLDDWREDHSYFGHPLTPSSEINADGSTTYYVTDEAFDTYGSVTQSTENIFTDTSLLQTKVDFNLERGTQWNTDRTKLVITRESDFDVIWTGLYGEDIVDYKDISGYNYNWENPKGYLWYYCKYYKDNRYNKIRATNYFTYELLRFDSDEPDIRIDVDNCIYFTNESKEEEGNYKIVINSVLEKTNTERKNGQDWYSNYSWDEEPGKNEEYYSNSNWYNIGLDPSVNPFTGYEVLGYEYNNSFTPKEYFRDRVTVYSNDILNLYYIRSSYYFTIANQEGVGNIYHLYKDNVDRLDLNNINMPYGVDSDYTFAGLFDSSDKDNATMVVAPDGNFVKEVKGNPDNDPTIFKYKSKYYQRSSYVMPAHNVQLFAHWDPPVRQVTFVLDENSTNTVVANDVHKGDTLSEVLAAHTEISKTRDDYQFVNWYYLDEAENEVLFPESAIILDDVTLYAKWQKVAGEGTYYLSAYDAQTSQPILDTDGKNVTYTGEAQIGSAVKVNVSMLADNNSALNGYVVVGDSEKSVDSLTDQYEFRFYFTKAAESWNYEVHCLANYGTDEDPIYYDLGTKTNSTTQDQILIDPGIFDNYYLQGIRNEGTVSAQTYAILNKPADTSETAQVYFIYKLDTDVIFSLEGNSKLYDGTACEATYNTISDKIRICLKINA